MSPVKIIIADDHPLLKQGLARLIAQEEGMCVVAEAANGQELLQKAETTEADIIITDVRMPVISGLEAIQLLAEKKPHLPCIAISFSSNPLYISKVMKAGAKAYCLKTVEPVQLLEAIQYVLKGDTFYCSETAGIMPRHEKELAVENSLLNCNEKKILVLMCEENTTKEIAAKLGFTIKTIESYSKAIKQKTGTRSIAGMVRYAIENFIYFLKK